MKTYIRAPLLNFSELEEKLNDDFEYLELKEGLEALKAKGECISSYELMHLLEMSLGHPDFVEPTNSELAAFNYLLNYGFETSLIDWDYNTDSGNVFELVFVNSSENNAKDIFISFLLDTCSLPIKEIQELFKKFEIDFNENKGKIKIHQEKRQIEKSIAVPGKSSSGNKI